tara:strand:- start:79 stop:801 length:723 start_codon:yes stop_codon:yes gene_type:complete
MEIALSQKPKRPIIIEGFPGIGFAGTIAVEYLLNHLDIKSIGRFASKEIPPIAMIHGKEVRRLLEIFYAPKENIIFLHAIVGIKGLEWEVANTILELAKTVNAKEIISLEGVVSPTGDGLSRIFVQSNNSKKEKEFRKIGAQKLETGAVTGVTGALMLSAEHVDSTFLFAETSSQLPDSRSAAELIKYLDAYLGLKVDPKPLIKQAEDFENKLKEMVKLSAEAQKNQNEDNTKKELSYLG